MADEPDDFTAEENEYFETVANDAEAQKRFERFTKWKSKKTPDSPPSQTVSSPSPTPLSLEALDGLVSNKKTRSILRHLLEEAEKSELESEGLTNPANPKAKPTNPPAKTPAPSDLAKTLRKFI
jgi:hypothetical protein